MTTNPKPSFQRSTSFLRYKTKPDPDQNSDQRRLDSSQRRTTPATPGPAYLRATKLIDLHQPASCKSRVSPKCRGRPHRPPPNLRFYFRLRFVVNRRGVNLFSFLSHRGRGHRPALAVRGHCDFATHRDLTAFFYPEFHRPIVNLAVRARI